MLAKFIIRILSISKSKRSDLMIVFLSERRSGFFVIYQNISNIMNPFPDVMAIRIDLLRIVEVLTKLRKLKMETS